MSNWNPKPRRDFNLNGLFSFEESGYTVYKRSPMQKQRQTDGTPHSTNVPSALKPNSNPVDRPLYVGGEVSKAQKPEETKYDADEVLKSYMAYGTVGGSEVSSSSGDVSGLEASQNRASRAANKDR